MRIGLLSAMVLWFGLVGCDEAACDVCTACSSWIGTYAGELQGTLGSTCGEPSSLDSPIRIRIYSIQPDPLTPTPERTQVELEMQHGEHWTAFKGTVCESQETEQPFSYAFHAEYRGEEVLDYRSLSIHNTISGLFASANPEQTDSVDQIAARYTASRTTHFNRPGAGSEFCQMLGTIQVYRR